MSELEAGTVAPVAAVETAPVAPVSAEPSTALGGDPAVAPSLSKDQIFEMFKGTLGDDVKDHSYISKYTNADDFAKAGISHQGALTKKASEYFESEVPEVVAERNKLMGIPDSADSYEITPELTEAVSEESLANFKAKAHEMGLPQKYVNELVQFEADLWTQNAANLEAEATASKEAATKALQETWTGDTYEHNTKQVMNLMTELGVTAEDMNVPLGNNVALIKALSEKVVPLFGEDKLIEGTMSQSSVSAGERIKALNIEMHGTAVNTPEYKALIAEKTALMSRMK